MAWFIWLCIGIAVGAIAMFFVYRNNRKELDAALAKVDELRQKLGDIGK